MEAKHEHVSEIDMVKFVNETMDLDPIDSLNDEQTKILARICECCEHGDECYVLMRRVVNETKVSRN